MSPDSDYSIRDAKGNDAQAVRMLLSAPVETFEYLLVAESGDPARVVAAAGLTTSVRPKPPVGPGVALHVIEPARRQGIGKELIKRLAAHAVERGAESVYATQKVASDSQEQLAWEALGFSICETVEHHELLLDEFEPQLAPLHDRMRQRGKIPDSARIIPLFEADLAEVVRLHLATMGGDRTTLLQKLRGEVPESFSPRYSRVLLIDGKVMGVILGHRVSREIVHVDANIVAPEIRGGWANVWLKLEATQGALQWGIKKFVFSTFDHYIDTRSFTDRLRGITVREMVLMHLPLQQ